jgi:hypothetical protein
MPAGPAGEIMMFARPFTFPSFLSECTVPRGMCIKSPGDAWNVRPAALNVTVPSKM